MKDYKLRISIALDIWATGGAEIGYKRLASKLPQYEWRFTTNVDPQADLVIYSNNHRFYEQAKKLNKPVVMRLTGPRSYNLSQPDDLQALICSSLAGYSISKHPKKTLIYNGIDFDHLKTIKPIECDLLLGCARIGVGQQVEKAIQYAIQNKRHLTVLGGKQHLVEDTYNILRKKYKNVNWTGVVDNDAALGYVKGCKSGIMPTSTHGVSNFIIELLACDKPIINIGGVEIPPIDQIDINVTVRKYKELIEGILE